MGRELAKNPRKCFSSRNISYVGNLSKKEQELEKETELDNISNQTLRDETKVEFNSSIFRTSITYKKDDSLNTISYASNAELDPMKLSDYEIKILVEKKMRVLDKFNKKLSKNKYLELKKKFEFKENDI